MIFSRCRFPLTTLSAVLTLAASGQQSVPPIVFVENAQSAGLAFILKNDAKGDKRQIETMPGGVAVIDYDNDGFEDLYFVNAAGIPKLTKSDSSFWNRLYRNRGDGTFEDVTTTAGVAGSGYGMAAAVADYDNDGWSDLFVAGVNQNILYRNNGDGTFADVTQTAGVAGDKPQKLWSISAGWFDYDNDGNLDLFVVNYCKWDPAREPYCGLRKPGYRAYCHPKHYEGLPNTLFRNNGDGTFTDVSVEAGITRHIGKGMGVAFADYDADGWMDVFVANDTLQDFLFRNNGKGKFTEVGINTGVGLDENGTALSSMGVDFRDVNNDGLPDLFITTLSNEAFPLLLNQEHGWFDDATYASRLGFLSLASSGWGAGIFDLNNDGWKDLFSAGSHVMDNEELYSSRRSKQQNQVFVNLGNGTFADAAAGSAPGVWKFRFHRGAAFADFDNDGRIDVVTSSLNEPVELLWNRSAAGSRWIQIALQGRRSNRDAIGAQVRVVDDAGRVQHNHVTTSVGYASSSTRRIHFGLGQAGSVKELEITWPSGTVQKLSDVPLDQLLKMVEPD